MKNRLELEFNGDKLGFSFGLGFMGDLLDSLDCSIDEIQDKLTKNPFKVIPRIMYDSYSYDCLRNDTDIKYSVLSFTDLLDDNGGIMSEKTSSFLKAFTESMTKDVPKEEVNPEKRQIKKTTPKKK